MKCSSFPTLVCKVYRPTHPHAPHNTLWIACRMKTISPSLSFPCPVKCTPYLQTANVCLPSAVKLLIQTGNVCPSPQVNRKLLFSPPAQPKPAAVKLLLASSSKSCRNAALIPQFAVKLWCLSPPPPPQAGPASSSCGSSLPPVHCSETWSPASSSPLLRRSLLSSTTSWRSSCRHCQEQDLSDWCERTKLWLNCV